MDHDSIAVDWNANTIFVLSRQLVREILEWTYPTTRYAPNKKLLDDYNISALDMGYMMGIIETRLDKELGIWINLRQRLDISTFIESDVSSLTSALHHLLLDHFQIEIKGKKSLGQI